MIRVDGTELRLFSQQLAEVPKELRREIRPRLRAAASDLETRVKGNAAWSDRIPAAVGLRVGFSGRSDGGITLRVDAAKAPHARPLEGRGQGGTFRHPVFGNRDVWVNQPTRPFFFPAVRTMQPQVVAAVQEVIDDALGKL